ncbi:hypothetical protein CROQUDRAFT_12404, partial [Cronartium quercuum f. sp. fusiforme G11]
LKDVVLPTGVTGMPSNLGEASAGTLKAVQWHSLFAYIIPLIVVEIYVTNPEQLKKESNRGQILFNIGALCQCTNIVCAKKVSDYEARQFQIWYRKYTNTSQNLFQNIKIRPNHHYTLHIPDQLRLWGPLNQVAKFGGERLIGFLQKIQTNTRLGMFVCLLLRVSGQILIIKSAAEMDGTMMVRFSQLQRLSGDNAIIEEIVGPKKKEKDPSQSRLRITLNKEEYDALLEYIQDAEKTIRHYQHMPHLHGAKVLQPVVVPQATWRMSNELLVSVLKPNNCIQYKVEDKTCYGMVWQIYQFCNPHQDHKWVTVFIINLIANLYAKKLESPSRNFRYILFL